MMNKTLLALLLLGGGVMMTPGVASAVSHTGQCTSMSGPHNYDPMINQTVSIPGGSQVALNWNEGTTFNGTCDCALGEEKSVLFKFATGFTNVNNRINIDPENGIEATFKVYIGGNRDGLVDVNFSQVEDNEQARQDECYDDGTEFASGGQGEITLYFKNSIKNNYNKKFPAILKIYAKKEGAGNFSTEPLSIVNLSINLTIPATCQLEPGTISVNFGTLAASDFAKGKGTGKQSVPLKVTCENPEDIAKAKITFKPKDFKDDLIITDDQNLGIKLEQGNSQLKGDSSISLNNGEATIYATPTQSGDGKPTIGKFNATATLNVEIN